MSIRTVPNGAPFKSVVVSRPGAAIQVEKLELTDAARRRLTTSVRSLCEPRREPSARAGRGT
ncbi:MAG TPA: hypothetical protein VFJ82_09780 [Longimicrobium sp.]|nr:hypothetical protein [Longimicrobium sp.]